jgi:hypothetical protein
MDTKHGRESLLQESFIYLTFKSKTKSNLFSDEINSCWLISLRHTAGLCQLGSRWAGWLKLVSFMTTGRWCWLSLILFHFWFFQDPISQGKNLAGDLQAEFWEDKGAGSQDQGLELSHLCHISFIKTRRGKMAPHEWEGTKWHFPRNMHLRRG